MNVFQQVLATLVVVVLSYLFLVVPRRQQSLPGAALREAVQSARSDAECAARVEELLRRADVRAAINSTTRSEAAAASEFEDSSARCPICIEDYRESEQSLLLPCGHRFHHRCAAGWLKQHDSCPICRSDVQKGWADGATALMLAARYGHAEALSLLLAAGADPSQTLAAGADPSYLPGAGGTALVLAAQNGHTEAVRRLLGHGAVDRQNADLALMLAARHGHAEAVSLLLAAGADPSQTEPGADYTALVLAARYGHTETVQRLLDHGAVDRQNAGLALREAAKNGHAAALSLLLAAGADPSQTWPGTDYTALVAAAQDGHTEAVRRLLGHGAVDRQNAGKALRLAQRRFRHAIVQLLREHAPRGAAVAKE